MRRAVYVTVSLALAGYLFVGQNGVANIRSVAGMLAPDRERGVVDFYQYWAAARDYRNGLSLYSPLGETFPDHRSHLGPGANLTADEVGNTLPVNAYPPFATLVFLPLSGLDFVIAHAVWEALGLAFAAAAVGVIVVGLGPWRSWVAPVAVFGLTAVMLGSSASLRHDIGAGNVGSLLLLLLALAWLSDRRGYAGWAGFWAALAFSLKLFPGLLFVYFFFAHRRAFWWMAGWAVVFGLSALAVFGWEEHVRFIESLPLGRRWYANFANYSVFGFWHRLFQGSWPDAVGENSAYNPVIRPLVAAPAVAKVASYVSGLGVTATLVVVARRPAAGRQARDALFAATVVAMLLMSPVSWQSTVTVALLPLLILWRLAFDRPPVNWALTGIAAVLWLHTVFWERRFHPPGTGGFAPWESATYVSFKTYALLGLFGIALWLARRPGPEPEAVLVGQAVPDGGSALPSDTA